MVRRAASRSDGALDRPWARVPESVAEQLRPELDAMGEAIIEAVRADVPDFARPMTGRFGTHITEGVSVALRQFLDLLGRDEPIKDVRIYQALGRLEHSEGRTIASLQAAYHVASRTLWRRLASSELAQRLPPEVIFRLAEALFTYVEAVSAASTEGWAAEEDYRSGSLQARRRILVELLARRPGADQAEIDHAAAAAGWIVPPRVVALVAEDAVGVASRLPGAIGADLAPTGVVILAEPDTAGLDRISIGLRGRPAVIGPDVEPTEACQSVARARAIWTLLRAGALVTAEPIVRADDHLLALLLAADPALAAELQERALRPLRDIPAGGAARAVETLRAWFDAHGDVTAAASALHVHPQTVRYRLAGLREVFGDALDDPDRRLEVALALRMPPPPEAPPAHPTS
jgi:hypothetical protein